MKKEDAVAAGLYKVIGKEIDDRYMEELKKQSIHPEVIKEMAKDIKIVYTPLHGTGNLPVRRVLKAVSYTHLARELPVLQSQIVCPTLERSRLRGRRLNSPISISA